MIVITNEMRAILVVNDVIDELRKQEDIIRELFDDMDDLTMLALMQAMKARVLTVLERKGGREPVATQSVKDKASCSCCGQPESSGPCQRSHP